MSLEAAVQALERGDHDAALRAALEAWQQCKHDRIAIVIDELSRRVASSRRRPGGKTIADKQASWLALAAAGDPGDVGNLLATLAEVKKRAELEARLAAIAGRVDPRIASALHAVLEHPPIPGATGAGSVRLMLRMLLEIRDPRSVAALEHVARVNAEGGGAATYELRRVLPVTLGALRGMARPVLTTSDIAALDAIDRVLARDGGTVRAEQSVAELYAAVYANPDDDGPRGVLADVLQELGDPRGELIALQLARGRDGKRTKRESTLLKQHARTWLGELAPVVLKTGLVFERGFLARCEVTARGVAGAVALTSSRVWATVEEVDVDSWDDDHVQALANAMPVLRVLRGVRTGRGIPSHRSLERVAIRFMNADDVPRVMALDVPALRELDIEWCNADLATMRPVLASLVRQLRSFCANGTNAQEWIPALATANLTRAGVSSAGVPWRLWFEGDRITAEYFWYDPPNASAGDQLAAWLALVPSPDRWHVAITCAVATSATLERALHAFASWTETRAVLKLAVERGE